MINKFPRKLELRDVTLDRDYAIMTNINLLVDKINEIIDVINKGE